MDPAKWRNQKKQEKFDQIKMWKTTVIIMNIDDKSYQDGIYKIRKKYTSY